MDFVKQHFQGLDVEDKHFFKDIIFSKIFSRTFQAKNVDFRKKTIFSEKKLKLLDGFLNIYQEYSKLD